MLVEYRIPNTEYQLIMKQLFTIFFLSGLISVSAQDTVQIYVQNQFFEQVRENHPLLQSADLLNEMALQELKIAKAGFDPKVKSDWEQKQFKEKEYYNLWQNKINLPTYYGLEVDAGYDVASGEFLNTENSLPEQGLGYLGISANLLQGLMIDERRANLKQANLGMKINENEQRLIINELLYVSGKVYWDWVFAYNQYQTLQRAYGLAEKRYDLVKQNFLIGETAGIDTLKALLQVQNRAIGLNEAENKLKNSLVKLSDFLWQNGQPNQLALNTVAPILQNSASINPTFQFNENHPELLKYDFKLTSLGIDERMKREKLKPKLKIKYNLLGQEFDLIQNGQDDGVVITQNYKAGVAFEMNPILRKERADLQLNQIKTEQANFDLINKRLTLQNKLNRYRNDFENNATQIRLTENMIQNYQALLNGEFEKFKVGESDLFIVNTRETQLIEAEIKLLKLLANQQKINLAIQWANGLLQ